MVWSESTFPLPGPVHPVLLLPSSLKPSYQQFSPSFSFLSYLQYSSSGYFRSFSLPFFSRVPPRHRFQYLRQRFFQYLHAHKCWLCNLLCIHFRLRFLRHYRCCVLCLLFCDFHCHRLCFFQRQILHTLPFHASRYFLRIFFGRRILFRCRVLSPQRVRVIRTGTPCAFQYTIRLVNPLSLVTIK